MGVDDVPYLAFKNAMRYVLSPNEDVAGSKDTNYLSDQLKLVIREMDKLNKNLSALQSNTAPSTSTTPKDGNQHASLAAPLRVN